MSIDDKGDGEVKKSVLPNDVEGDGLRKEKGGTSNHSSEDSPNSRASAPTSSGTFTMKKMVVTFGFFILCCILVYMTMGEGRAIEIHPSVSSASVRGGDQSEREGGIGRLQTIASTKVPTTTIRANNVPTTSLPSHHTYPPQDAEKITRTIHKVSPSSRLYLPLVVTTNPIRECQGIQPNRTAIEPYKKCPLPGLNNLLYTQINRWYCIWRDKSVNFLRDRTCDKSTDTPYRFSTILNIQYDDQSHDASHQQNQQQHMKNVKNDNTKNNLVGGKRGVLCWSDISKQQAPQNCAWGNVLKFYGKADWWKARRRIDFHAHYYQVAREYIRRYIVDTGGEEGGIDHDGDDVAAASPHASSASRMDVGEFKEKTEDKGGRKKGRSPHPFIAIHLRRGDYFTHCVYLQKKKQPPWVTFFGTPSLAALKLKEMKKKKMKKKEEAAAKNEGLETISPSSQKWKNAKKYSTNSNSSSEDIVDLKEQIEKFNVPIRSCYPSLDDIFEALLQIQNQTKINTVFFATNDPSEFQIGGDDQEGEMSSVSSQNVAGGNKNSSSFSSSFHKKKKSWTDQRSKSLHDLPYWLTICKQKKLKLVFFNPKFVELRSSDGSIPGGGGGKVMNHHTGALHPRRFDLVILEMAIMALGAEFIFNPYSSFSGSVFEMAVLRGSIDRDDVNGKARYGSNFRVW